jgi:putative tryptophan/tyrosine transport system substrate-binding protein
MTIYSRRQVVQAAGIAGLGLLAGCGRLPWQTPPPPRIARIGWLSQGQSPAQSVNLDWFRQDLGEHGWSEGRNLIIETRFAEGRDERLPTLAAELTQLPVDIIVTAGTFATVAASEATRSIPIVFATGADPVSRGLATSYPRPGGNITGITVLTAGLSAKRLELLREAVPGAARVAVLWKQPDVDALQETQRAAEVLTVPLYAVEVHGPDDLDAALEAARLWGADALAFEPHPLFASTVQQLADFAARHRLPAISGSGPFARAGGLMNYAARIRDNYRRAAYYVDRILKGAKPADLPVEQPREFDLVINLHTAQALGLTIPHHVLLQATELIQ